MIRKRHLEGQSKAVGLNQHLVYKKLEQEQMHFHDFIIAYSK